MFCVVVCFVCVHVVCIVRFRPQTDSNIYMEGPGSAAIKYHSLSEALIGKGNPSDQKTHNYKVNKSRKKLALFPNRGNQFAKTYI